jgi:serine/threonine protein kinase
MDHSPRTMMDITGRTICGSVRGRKYDVREKLGQGAFGCVYRVCERKTGFEYALKVIPVRGVNRWVSGSLLHECRVLETIRAVGCSRFVACAEDIVFCKESGMLCLLLELCVKVDWAGMNAKQTCAIVCEVWRILKQLHANGIIHGDVCRVNVMCGIGGKSCKLVDWGYGGGEYSEVRAQVDLECCMYLMGGVSRSESVCRACVLGVCVELSCVCGGCVCVCGEESGRRDSATA